MPDLFEIHTVKIVLWAQDMDRALAFHRAVFGFETHFESSHWSELSQGDTVIALHGGGDGSSNRSGLSLEVSDLRVACATAREHGATILKAPESRPGEPIELAEIRDPDGNVIVLTADVVRR